MKIYFTGSLHNRDIDKRTYREIVKLLTAKGHNVKAEHILDKEPVKLDTQSPAERSLYYDKLNKWISDADLVVCEVSYPSTINIGHEVSLALDKGKPVLALYQKGRNPGVLQGIKSEKFLLVEYTADDVDDALIYGLDEAVSQMDVRFNFFISPAIGRYLDWVARKKRIPRAVYLRRLIEVEMKENKDYAKEQ